MHACLLDCLLKTLKCGIRNGDHCVLAWRKTLTPAAPLIPPRPNSTFMAHAGSTDIWQRRLIEAHPQRDTQTAIGGGGFHDEQHFWCVVGERRRCAVCHWISARHHPISHFPWSALSSACGRSNFTDILGDAEATDLDFEGQVFCSYQ